MSISCRICGSNNLATFRAKEMVLGTGISFDYEKCANCYTIQISEIPSNLSDYYPSDYYSFQIDTKSSVYSKLKAPLIIKRDLYALNIKTSFVGKLMQRLKPAVFDARYLAYAFVYEKLIRNNKITIHDAGCGNGFFLKYFHDLGFRGLSGSDPFLSEHCSFGHYTVYKGNLDDLKEQFDVILLNHVIEHVLNPIEYLKLVYEKLNPGGECLIRTPMSTSSGFRKYEEYWVGLEPPRHLHILDKNHFKKISESLGFECTRIEFDSLSWHYEASEAYMRQISLVEMEKNNPFTSEELITFERLACEANLNKTGDTVAYYLKKK